MKDFFKLVFKFTLIMFIILGIIFGIFIAYSKITGKEIDFGDNIFTEKKEPVTVLVAGLHPDGPLTDFIMLAKYNPETKRINALSVPRDTKVVGTVDGKINSAYARGKDINKLKDKVQDLTGIEAEHYVIFDTAAVRKMVDAIGGIPVDVPMNMKYDDNEQNLHIDLKKGYQVLDGKKAEQFIRFRKGNDGSGYPLGDVQRIQTQHAFIKAAVNQVLKPSTLLKLPELISLGLESVKTDMKMGEILGYLDDVKEFDTNNLRMETLPGEGKYIDNISYFVFDPVKSKKLVEDMFINEVIIDDVKVNNNDLKNTDTKKDKKEIKINNKDISIEVLNGTSKSGLANSVAEKLRKEGYNVTKIGNYKTTSNISTSIINRNEKGYAKYIKEYLKIGKIKNENDKTSKVDVTVILGNDYK